jgi:lysophospholipase L1-like esterase
LDLSWDIVMRLISQSLLAGALLACLVFAEDAAPEWKYDPVLLAPFWTGDTTHGESILFIHEAGAETARGDLLFPPLKILAVRNSNGDVTYEEQRDYTWNAGSRTITIPAGSRIITKTPQDLRRPAKSQKYELTHRDGNGEILFGSRLEYHDMQTCITYTHEPGLWKVPPPKFAETQLPRTISKLRNKQPVSLLVLGDSISAGCNASGWAGGVPYQPPFTGLIEKHLAAVYDTEVSVRNLSVGGKETSWAVTVADDIIAAMPDIVILAFGMNDSAGRPAKEYQGYIESTIKKVQEQRPETEFILVASMLGNRDWIRLKQELFPQYRDALAELCRPGVALADLTSQWTAFLERKKDWDLTGNGVNHPNDFGHRVYAQVIMTLLIPEKKASMNLPPRR